MDNSRKNQNNTLFSKRMYSLRKDGTFDKFPKFFGVSRAKFSRFLNGKSSPSLDELREFALNYAADNEAKLIDLNWLIDENDRRSGPVFIAGSTTSDPIHSHQSIANSNVVRVIDPEPVDAIFSLQIAIAEIGRHVATGETLADYPGLPELTARIRRILERLEAYLRPDSGSDRSRYNYGE